MGVGVGVASLAFHWWSVSRFIETTDDAYVHGEITQLSAETSGTVIELAVSDNQRVEAGDLLVRIDDREPRARVAAAGRNVASRKAALVTLAEKIILQDSLIEGADAELSGARATATLARQELDRARTLVRTDTGSRQRLDSAVAEAAKAEAGERRARAGLAAARQEGRVLTASQGELEAALAQAEAILAVTEVDLRRTTVRAPVAGVVGNRAVRLGQYARPGSVLLSLAQETVWVEANFKETQLAALAVGQKARIVVDAYPDPPIEGRVASLAPASGAVFSLLPPENATGNFTKVVQRVPVRIEVPAETPLRGLLRPGLSVTVSVDSRR